MCNAHWFNELKFKAVTSFIFMDTRDITTAHLIYNLIT